MMLFALRPQFPCVLLISLALAPVRARAADSSAAPAPAPALTLESAIDLALRHNERSLKAPERVEVAAGGLDRARTAFYPSLVGQGNGAYSSIADRSGNNFSGNLSLTATQPIFNLSAFPLLAQARHTLEAERWGAVEDLRVLAFDTTNAFVTVLAAEQLLVAAQQRVNRAQVDMSDTAARASAGLTSTNDVTRAQVAVATAQQQEATAQGNVVRAYLQLGYLVGQPVTGPLQAPDATVNNARHGAWDRDAVAHRAEGRRPDVLSAAAHTESLRDSAKEPLYRAAPSLGLSAQLRQILDPQPTDVATSLNAQLTLTWILFDAGVRYADRRTRLAQLESASLDERALRRSVATDIAIAVAGLHAARASYEISDLAVKTAQKNIDETQVLYKQGLAKAIEVTDANASLYDAQVARAVAKLSMEQAYLNLRYALGLGPITEELPRVKTAKELGQ